MALDHEKLEVYQKALDFVAVAEIIAGDLPHGRSYLADQLRRASTSIALNVAEGAGKFAAKDKSRFYLMARGSATECGAILDVCCRLSLIAGEETMKGKSLLEEVVAMLTRLIQAQAKR